MSKIVFKCTRYTVTTNVEDAIRWLTPGRMGTIRKKLVKYPNTEIFNNDICLVDSLVFICKRCQNANGEPVEIKVQKRKEYNGALLEILKEMGFISIIKKTNIFDIVYDENERYEKDGVMHFPCELDYVYWLLGMFVHGNCIPLFGEIHSLFDSVEAFQDAIVEGQSNWDFMAFSTDKEAHERLDKKAMVKYIRDDGTIRFEAYKNAYDYAKRKKEER